MSTKNKTFNILLKVALVGLIVFLIYRQILCKAEISEIKKLFVVNLRQGNWSLLIFCVLLMPLNWLVESIKWKVLINKYQPLSLLQSMRSILAGISIGIVTPQRLGEYGGRVLTLSSKNKIFGVLATFLGSLFQNLVNVIFGLVGIFFLNQELGMIDQYWMTTIVVLVVCFLFLAYLVYRNTAFAKKIISKSSLSAKVKNWLYKLAYFKKVSPIDHLKVFLLSVLRYGIYVMQYVLILWFFGIETTLFQSLCGISSIYLIQTGLPLPPIFDIAARAELAYFIWGNYSENVLGILSATFGLWIINLIIPSLFGLFYVLKTNIFKSTQH